MAISFECGCGKSLRAGDELAGRKTRCPDCGAILRIPESAPMNPEPDLDVEEDSDPYELEAPARPAPTMGFRPRPVSGPDHDPDPEEGSAEGSTFHTASRRPEALARPQAATAARRAGESTLLEYSYLLLVFALIPLAISMVGREPKSDMMQRLADTIAQAPAEEQARIKGVLEGGEVTLDQAIAALPGGRLLGAHLARDTSAHWIYAAVAATGFLLLLGLMFSVERAHPLHLLGIGAFTGTVGVLLLLGVQFCSNFRLRGIHGRGVVVIALLILTFIGWSYDSANDPESNFFLSALGFTCGVGLCEEATKALPMLFAFRRHATMGWRTACLWGLASGIGFGVSEGVMYSARYYNGMSGGETYLVRFVSCVALHAIWSGAVGIAIARRVEAYEAVEDAAGYGLFLLRVVAVPMVLHGFYDTLLKQDMELYALGVALLSFAWLAWSVERARADQPEAGLIRSARRRLA